MKFKVRWTSNAYTDFSQITEYIKDAWGKSAAENFVIQVDSVIKILSIFPYLGKTIYSQKEIRGFVFSKQTTMVYRIKSEQIIILNLFDNRKDPDKLKVNDPNVQYSV